MAKKIFAANWKLNKSPNEARRFMGELSLEAKGNPQAFSNNQVLIFPSALAMEAVLSERSSQRLPIAVGLQNAHQQASGAFTGENSAAVLKEMGGEYVLLGHSERRSLFAETDEALANKLAFVQSLGLVPMLCIGESLNQREAGNTNAVLAEQLKNGLSKARPDLPLTIAYEPVWAIGTGRVATEEQVQETHAFVANALKELGQSGRPILYGGSVKADNAKSLIRIQNVDGFLVGGASLEVKSFMGIVLSGLE